MLSCVLCVTMYFIVTKLNFFSLFYVLNIQYGRFQWFSELPSIFTCVHSLNFFSVQISVIDKSILRRKQHIKYEPGAIYSVLAVIKSKKGINY